jgi:hypothetical protein
VNDVIRWKKVIIGPEIDLDTIATGFFTQVTRSHPVHVFSGSLLKEDNDDSLVLCIKVGSDGLVNLSNFELYRVGESVYIPSVQAYYWQSKNIPVIATKYGSFSEYVELIEQARAFRTLHEYVDLMSDPGYHNIRPPRDGEYLHDLFENILLVSSNPIERFYRGIELIRDFYKDDPRRDPFLPVKETINRPVNVTNRVDTNRRDEMWGWAKGLSRNPGGLRLIPGGLDSVNGSRAESSKKVVV